MEGIDRNAGSGAGAKHPKRPEVGVKHQGPGLRPIRTPLRQTDNVPVTGTNHRHRERRRHPAGRPAIAGEGRGGRQAHAVVHDQRHVAHLHGDESHGGLGSTAGGVQAGNPESNLIDQGPGPGITAAERDVAQSLGLLCVTDPGRRPESDCGDECMDEAAPEIRDDLSLIENVS
jgi:hypothetical protein